MTQSLVQGIIDALSGSVGKEAIVFIISMIPILELRGALLVAGPLLGVPVAKANPCGRSGVFKYPDLACNPDLSGREPDPNSVYPASDHTDF